MSDDEVMRFEITDDDIQNEFNYNLKRPKISKNQATYGIWAENSDEDDDPDARPTFSGATTRGKKIKASGNYTAHIGFVSAGIQKSRKEQKSVESTQEQSTDNNRDDDGSGSEEESTFSAGLGFKGGKSKARFGAKKFSAEPVESGQIAGLRTAGYQPPASLGKGFGDWEKNTRGIGSKILLQMGFQAGKGLGKELQGRNTIIEAHLRKGRGAIGAYGREGGMKAVNLKPDSEEEEETEFKEKLHQWKKGESSKKKVKYIYKSADQVLEEGKWRKVSSSSAFATGAGGAPSKVKVIDMTGKEQRILSGYHAIGNQKMLPDEDVDTKSRSKANFDLPELRHNIDMLLDQCEEDLISADRKLKHNKNNIDIFQNEEEKLSQLVEHEKGEIQMLEKVLSAVEKIEKLHENKMMDLHKAKEEFARLKEEYPKEYRSYELPYIASTVVVPLLRAEIERWNILEEPRRFREEFLQWRDLLTIIPANMSNTVMRPEPGSLEMDPFHTLLWETFMPRIRTAIVTWNSRHPDSLLEVLDTWHDLTPIWMVNNIHDNIILPKLQTEVELWNPLTDRVPLHSWLHPWLPRLGTQLEIVYPTIRNKLSAALTAWHPSDRSAKLILLPWKDVFSKGSMHAFILKNILPKLEIVMQELVINPLCQRLDEWNWVMEWQDMLAPAAFVTMLEKFFFPRWLQVLAGWLNHSPNYDEVVKWYRGWKAQLPPEVLSSPQIKSQLTQALNMMNRVVSFTSGHPMSQQPGAVEAMAYLTSLEKDTMTGLVPPQPPLLQQPPPPPPPPPALSDRPSGGGIGYKDLVARRCEERGILFAPVIPQKFYESKQIYKCGTAQVYLDRNAIFVLTGDKWVPTSLNMLLDSA